MSAPSLNFLTLACADVEQRSIDGVDVLEEPFDSPHGFRGFSARDPEGNLWDVAWKTGSNVTPNGDLTWN